jgi:hypothetical protein
MPITLLKDSPVKLALGPGLDGGPPRELLKVLVGQRDADGMNQPPSGHSQDAKQHQAQERRSARLSLAPSGRHGRGTPDQPGGHGKLFVQRHWAAPQTVRDDGEVMRVRTAGISELR